VKQKIVWHVGAMKYGQKWMFEHIDLVYSICLFCFRMHGKYLEGEVFTIQHQQNEAGGGGGRKLIMLYHRSKLCLKI
jgi:hypothetical protein